MKVSWDDEIPNIWKDKTCSKLNYQPDIIYVYIYIPIPGWIDAKEPNLAGDSHRMSTYVNYSAHS